MLLGDVAVYVGILKLYESVGNDVADSYEITHLQILYHAVYSQRTLQGGEVQNYSLFFIDESKEAYELQAEDDTEAIQRAAGKLGIEAGWGVTNDEFRDKGGLALMRGNRVVFPKRSR